MSLRKSPIRTAALLAACRSNAQKSTGPRTPEGKARSRLNSLRHGRSCRTLHRRLPEGLSFRNRLIFNWIHRAIENCFQPQTEGGREQMRRLAVQVWCEVVGVVGEKVGRTGNLAESWPVRPQRLLSPRRFRLERSPQQHLTFWTQAWGRRARRVCGRWRPRAQGLFAIWHGHGPVARWRWEPTPDPEQDPVGHWHWRRYVERQRRAYRRARIRQERQVRKWRAVLDEIYLGCLGTGRTAETTCAGGDITLAGLHQQLAVKDTDRGTGSENRVFSNLRERFRLTPLRPHSKPPR